MSFLILLFILYILERSQRPVWSKQDHISSPVDGRGTWELLLLLA